MTAEKTTDEECPEDPDNAFKTPWTIIYQAAQNKNESATEALERLCMGYHKPILTYIMALGNSRSDAEDLTQEFLITFIKRQGFSKADKTKGKFRTYLKKSIRRFVTDQHRKMHAQRREGSHSHVSVEDSQIDLIAETEETAKLLDQAWVEATMERAVAILRKQYPEAKHQLFDDNLPSKSKKMTREEIMEKHELTSNQLAVFDTRFRQKFTKVVRQVVAETVETPEEIEEELRFFRQVWMGE